MLAALPLTGAWTEVIGCVESIGGLGLLLGAYRLIECRSTGCHRLGRFRHGHLRLCSIHHPLTPDDGKVGARHIAAAVSPDTRLHQRLDSIERAVGDVHAQVAGHSGQAEPEREPPQGG